MEPHVVSLKSISESPFCVDVYDGQQAHEKIANLLARGERVVISFEGVERLTTAFLNAAIGQLYNEFPETVIRELISIVDADASSKDLLRRVTNRAKQFYELNKQH